MAGDKKAEWEGLNDIIKEKKKRMGNLWKKSSPFSFSTKKLSSRHFPSYLKIVWISFPACSLKGMVYGGSVK